MRNIGPKSKVLVLGYLYFAIVTYLCTFLKLHFIVSTFLFLVLPTLILIFLNRKIFFELTLFCFSLGIPLGLYIQVVAERNYIWKYTPFFDFFQAQNMPLEALFWYPAWFGLVIATYLYFVDKHKHSFVNKISFKKHLKYFAFCLSLFMLSVSLMFLDEKYLVFPYPYLTTILPMGLVSLLLFWCQKHTSFLKILLPTTLILFLPMLAYDLTGVYSGQWTFPGHYLFVIDFGIAKLPVEEFIIWLMILPASVIAYFEEYEKNI